MSNAKSVSAVLLAAAAGFIGAMLLHSYPKDYATRYRFCLECAQHEETYREGVILGARSSTQAGGSPLHVLLDNPAEEHTHVFTDWATIPPTSHVAAEHPEIRKKALLIAQIERDPKLISALYRAKLHDSERTTQLIRALLDPRRELSASVVHRLGQEAPWATRWALVDAALAASTWAPSTR